MRPPALSICIPTYNFGRFIGETLDSIIPQVTDEVEIVILDGGSTDNTKDVVESRMRKTDRIRYVRQEEKGGIDRDIARNVELAKGEYCWLFSADDLMKKDAIGVVLNEIKLRYDIYLVGFTFCTFDMKPLFQHPILAVGTETVFDLGNEKERLAYLDKAMTTTAIFSFMSSMIIRKSRWDSVDIDDEFYCSYWGIAARIFKMFPDGLKVKYIPRSFLEKRGDNDSFMDQGIVHRQGIAIHGYHRLAEFYFGDFSPEALRIRKVLTRELPLLYLFQLKIAAKEEGRPDNMASLNQLVAKLYRDGGIPYRVRQALFVCFPVPLLKILMKSVQVAAKLKHSIVTPPV